MKNKNLIYIVALDGKGTKVMNSDYSIYSIYSWKEYCEKYDIDLFILNNENVKDFMELYEIPPQNFPIWFKEYVYKFAKGYSKIGIVDSDTIVSPYAPNIFDSFSENDFCGVSDLCDLNWILSSISDRKGFFPDFTLDIFKYINAGVLFFGNKHLNVFEKLINLYLTNQKEIDDLCSGGKEQTLLNYVIQSMNIDVRLLEPSWNLLSIHRKNMLNYNWQLNVDPVPYFIKYAYIWHFTGFPIEHRVGLMKNAWMYIEPVYKNIIKN